MRTSMTLLCSSVLVACGTGLDEGVAVVPTAPSRWELSFGAATDIEGALTEYNCTGEEPVAWRVSDGHLAVSAACIPPEDSAEGKVLRASMIRFPSGEFGYGWLVAKMRPSDDDSWGLVWGPERAYFRFMAQNDTFRGSITLVATPGADFAGREHPEAPDEHRHVVLSSMPGLSLPFDRLAEVAVYRSPERTAVYIDRQPVTWFVGDPGTAGPVGFYSARMDELTIDHVAIYEPGPPPWERVATSPTDSERRK